MGNIRIGIQYLGTNYHGWQIQATGPTIQGEIQKALRKITRESIHIIGSGRTDAGVHAMRQVANFLTESKIPATNLMKALNSMLPEDISITDIQEVHPSFHARKDARKKTYVYRIMESHVRLPLFLNRAWVLKPGLDLQSISEACACFIGTHDFKGIQKSGSSVKSTVRTVYECRLETNTPMLTGSRCLEIVIAANGFLRYMVRNIVGLLVEIGMGRLAPSHAKRILREANRIYQFRTAPPYGLYLKDVFY